MSAHVPVRIALVALVAFAAPRAAAEPQVADCKGPLEASVPDGCAGVDAVGCCDVMGRALWCEGDNLYCLDCAADFPACGWNPLGYYACGEDAGSADPSGVSPISCDSCPAACEAGAACSPECVGRCGVCADGEVCLADGSCYAPQCGASDCGVDPLGFSCGVCDAASGCVAPVNVCSPLPAGCAPRDGPGCGDGCGCEACVCAAYPECCTLGWDALCAAACEAECGADCAACPLAPSCDGLACGDFCGLDCGTCPGPDDVCLGGACCARQCGGAECGPDGCGGTCGECPAFDTCAAGKCEACEPSCPADAECGPDGCGGTCGGGCDASKVCVDGLCTVGLCANLCVSTLPVDCGPGCQCFCDPTCQDFGDCCAGYCAACQAGSADCCVANCQDKVCGGDGCGGSCGGCPGADSCVAGVCVPCEPACEGRVCGPDGCGGACGLCPGFDTCDDAGACQPCVPACEGRVCGDDGCGGVCGVCSTSEACGDGVCGLADGGACAQITLAGCCDEEHLFACVNGKLLGLACASVGGCGWDGDDGYVCGGAGADPSGAVPRDCCQPDCSGVACGDDGCGGVCGPCPPFEACTADGRCELCTPDCASPLPELDQKVCGSDGCGGSCGTCEADALCVPGDGVCVCAPQCGDRVCGDDGCGGSCGQCVGQNVCDGGQCVCAPTCDGQVCGGDGCGGSCGLCGVGLVCLGGACLPPGTVVEPEPDVVAEGDSVAAAAADGGGGGGGCGGCAGGGGHGPGWLWFGLVAWCWRRARAAAIEAGVHRLEACHDDPDRDRLDGAHRGR